MKVEVNRETFDDEVLNSTMPVLVDFWANWCTPCKLVEPIVDDIAKKYSSKLKVCSINVDKAGELATSYNIRSIPTLLIFKHGEPVDSITGALPRDLILRKLNQHLH
ncbi:thioredoxin [bacterium]|nr:thioredoxin [bacterium]